MKPSYSHNHTVLSNGLRVITIELPHLHTAVISCYVKAGSRYEDTDTNGLSHYVEHMLFRGAGPYKDSSALVQAIETTGIELSALTMRDCCLYEFKIQPEQVESALQLLALILLNPHFEGGDVEKEIVLQEIMEDFDEHGQQIDSDNLSKAHLWPSHPLGFPITGSINNVNSFSRADLIAHHGCFYNAANMILCIAGPFEHQKIEDYAAATFEAIPPGQRIQEDHPNCSSLGSPRFLFTQQRGSSKTQLQINFRGFALTDPDIIGLEFVHRILDDGLSARLHKRICDELGLAYDIFASVESYVDTGLFIVETSASHDRIPRLLQEIFAVLHKLKERGVEESELQRVKRRYSWELQGCLDSVEAMASWYGGSQIFYNPDTIEERLSKVLNTNTNDISDVCGRIFRAEGLVVVSVGGLSATHFKSAQNQVELIDW